MLISKSFSLAISLSLVLFPCLAMVVKAGFVTFPRIDVFLPSYATAGNRTHISKVAPTRALLTELPYCGLLKHLKEF